MFLKVGYSKLSLHIYIVIFNMDLGYTSLTTVLLVKSLFRLLTNSICIMYNVYESGMLTIVLLLMFSLYQTYVELY